MSKARPIPRQLRERLRRCCERLAHLIDLNAPDIVVINDLMILIHYSEAAFGTRLWERLGERSAVVARYGAGLCAECDSALGPGENNPLEPRCPPCRARLEQQIQELEAEEQAQHGEDYGPSYEEEDDDDVLED